MPRERSFQQTALRPIAMHDRNSFVPFGPDHMAVLLLTGTIAVIVLIARNHFSGACDRWVRICLALGLVLAGGSGWVTAWMQGYLLIPLNLCDLALMAAIWALFTLQPWACQLVYFWGLAGSLQAVLTPDLMRSFPDFWWFQFFATHVGVVLSAVYLAATHRVEPTLRSVAWVWLISNAYMAVFILINWRYGTNFGYLSEKPTHPSLLDYFGPWPIYLIAIEVIGIISLLLLYVPVARARRRSQEPA